MLNKIVTHSEVFDRECNFLAKHQLQEDLVEREVNDAGVQHRLRNELANNTENMRSFSVRKRLVERQENEPL